MPDEIICNFYVNISYLEISATYDSKNKRYSLSSKTGNFNVGVKGFEKLLSIFEKIGHVMKINEKTYKIIIQNKILNLKHLYSKKNKTHTLEILDEYNNLMKLSGKKLIDVALQLFKTFKINENIENSLNVKKTENDIQIINNNQNLKIEENINDSKTKENDNKCYREIIDRVLKSRSEQLFIENLENIPPKSVIYSITGAFSFIFGLGVLCETLESGKIRWKAIILGFIILILILAIVNYLMMKEKNVDEHEYNIPTKLMEDVYTTDCENFPCGYFPK
ncbi:hypothetical protein [Methanocaldococcus jannaschii]|nr:hypothetical protein [Methanocaldococcus jannaschii]